MNENGQKMTKSIMQIENIVLVSCSKVAQRGAYTFIIPQRQQLLPMLLQVAHH